MSSILSKLFGSVDRLKIIRLFLLNAEEVFLPKSIVKRAKASPASVRREINLLSGIGFVHKKKFSQDGKKKEGWCTDSSFLLLEPLKELVLDTTPLSRTEFLGRLRKAGQIKLVILSGIFIKHEDSRVDILVVGDKIRKNALEKILKEAEAEIGKELVYAVFTTDDFVYRLNIYDKFIRDILDYPHQKIMNKLGI
ncbi:MAG: hypothetical protein ABIJ85_02440 [bacterium]|nr:hypothetical protein [Patescibacteria group bacterium]